MGKDAVLEAGQLLEGVARKIRRHGGEFSNLEIRVIRLHIEAALELIPNPPRPGELGYQAPVDDNGAATKVRTTRTLAGHRPTRKLNL
jgi:hypothetical protein